MIPALITVAVILVLTVVLPVLSFGRASAAQDSVKRLERQLAALEDLVRRSRSARSAAAPEPGALDTAAATAATAGALPATVETPRTSPAPDLARPAPSGSTQTAPARLEARIGPTIVLLTRINSFFQ